MNATRDYLRRALALPLEEQRETLQPAYAVAYAAYGRNWELNTLAFSDDYECHWAGVNRMPGIGTWRGREEYIREQTRLLEHLNVERVELDEIIPLGDQQVVALFRFIVRAGEGTIDQQVLDHHLYRDGELVRQTIWFDREEGLRELGLA